MDLRPGRARPASREQLRGLIVALLDEREVAAQLPAVGRRRPRAALDYFNDAANGLWVMRPAARCAAIRALDDYAVNARMAEQSDAVAAERVAAAYDGWARVTDSDLLVTGGAFGTPKATRTVPRHSRWFEYYPHDARQLLRQHFRVLAERRMTAVIVAIRLYRLDHDDAIPGDLARLVPDYLPAVPADPFRGDGGPVGYVVLKRDDGVDRPLVFVDAGAPQSGPISPEPILGWQHVQGLPPDRSVRQYRDATLWVPKVRSFDIAAEARRREQEALDADLRRDATDESDPEAVDHRPGEPDATRQ